MAKNQISAQNVSRRDFSIAGLIGLAAAASGLAFPQIKANASEQTVTQVPSIELAISNGDETLATYRNGIVEESNSCCLEIENGSVTTVRTVDGFALTESIGISVRASNGQIRDNTYEDLGVTIHVYIEYTFFRGQLTIKKAGVDLTDIAEGASWSGRYLIAYQGLAAQPQTKVEQFDSDSYAFDTEFQTSTYQPTNAGGMNGATFQGVLSARNLDEHLVTAKIEF